MSDSLFLPLDLVFIHKNLPKNFKVRRFTSETFRNVQKQVFFNIFRLCIIATNRWKGDKKKICGKVF